MSSKGEAVADDEGRRAAAALLKKKQDALKLAKPTTAYTGGKGPNPFTATAEDPYNNRGVQKPNDYTSSELSVNKQGMAVSAAINGVITKQTDITHSSLETVVREFSTLMQINDPQQVKILYNFTFDKTAQEKIEYFAKLSDLQGEFHIEFTPANTERRASAKFDPFALSVPRFIDLMERYIMPQTESTKAEQTQLPIKMQVAAAASEMAKQFFSLNLNNLSTVQSIMETMVKLKSPLTNNKMLENYVKSTEGSYAMSEELAKAIRSAANGSTVPAHVKNRYQWIVQRLPSLDNKANGTSENQLFEELLEDLLSILQGLCDSWLNIKGLLRPDQITAINMPAEDLRKRLQIRDDVLKKMAENKQQGNNTKRDHASSSSSSSASYSDIAKGQGGPSNSSKEDKDGGSKKKKIKISNGEGKKAESVNTDPPLCNACGNSHKYHAEPGFKCPYLKHDHPQANREEPTKAWADSKAGKAFKTRSKLDRLPYAKAYATDKADELTPFEPMEKKKVGIKEGAK